MVQDRAHEIAKRAQARQRSADEQDEQDEQDQQAEQPRQGSESLTEEESRRLADAIDRVYRRGR